MEADLMPCCFTDATDFTGCEQLHSNTNHEYGLQINGLKLARPMQAFSKVPKRGSIRRESPGRS